MTGDGAFEPLAERRLREDAIEAMASALLAGIAFKRVPAFKPRRGDASKHQSDSREKTEIPLPFDSKDRVLLQV